MEDQNYRLIIEYFEKTIDDRGLTQLQEWIEEDPEHLDQFIETLDILEAARQHVGIPQKTEENLQRLRAHTAQAAVPQKSLRLWPKWLSYAAILLAIAGCGLLGYRYLQTPVAAQTEFAEISNPNGQHSRIMLPDSSVVILGGGSRIRYAKQFDGPKRAIYLDGEAFFDVIHQPKRPFIVQSGNISTVVMGTSFNVKAFAADKKVVVTVNTGKVGVLSTLNGKRRLISYLTPDQEIEIDTSTGLYTFGNTNSAEVSAWTNNEFVFYDTPIKDITIALERRYGVKFEFIDPELGKTRLTAKFRNISINQVMDNLRMLSGLGYTQKGDQIFITNYHQKGGKIMD